MSANVSVSESVSECECVSIRLSECKSERV